mgnify:CR=1 FL=1
MAQEITNLKPQAIWKYFAKICSIPHPSGHTAMIADYLMEAGKELGLEKILISCIDGNIGSEKTILKNGGVYESTVCEPDRNRNLKRFWITL